MKSLESRARDWLKLKRRGFTPNEVFQQKFSFCAVAVSAAVLCAGLGKGGPARGICVWDLILRAAVRVLARNGDAGIAAGNGAAATPRPGVLLRLRLLQRRLARALRNGGLRGRAARPKMRNGAVSRRMSCFSENFVFVEAAQSAASLRFFLVRPGIVRARRALFRAVMSGG